MKNGISVVENWNMCYNFLYKNKGDVNMDSQGAFSINQNCNNKILIYGNNLGDLIINVYDGETFIALIKNNSSFEYSSKKNVKLFFKNNLFKPAEVYVGANENVEISLYINYSLGTINAEKRYINNDHVNLSNNINNATQKVENSIYNWKTTFGIKFDSKIHGKAFIIAFIIFLVFVRFYKLRSRNNVLYSDTKVEEFVKYNGAYISENIDVKLNDNNDIVYINDTDLGTELNYDYVYDSNNLVQEIKFDGTFNNSTFYGEMNFQYENNDIKTLNASNFYAGIEYDYIFEYEYNNGKLSGLSVKNTTVGITNEKDWSYYNCKYSYYNNYVLEECGGSNYTDEGRSSKGIYILNDLSEDKKSVWNMYQISPTPLYDYGYYNIHNNALSIYINNSIGTPYYLGKQIYYSYKVKRIKNDHIYTDEQTETTRYFDSFGRILMVKYKNPYNTNVYYMYLDDGVKVLEDSSDLNNSYSEREIVFNDNGYIQTSNAISSYQYDKKIKLYEKYFQDNVKHEEITDILDNWDDAIRGIYNVKYYDEPSVNFLKYNSSYVNVEIGNVGNWEANFNDISIKDKCKLNKEKSLVECLIPSEYLKLGENLFELLVSNENYQNISYKVPIINNPDEIEVFVGERNFYNYNGPETLEYDFKYYATSIKAPELIVNVNNIPGDTLTYTIIMDDISVSGSFDVDSYKHFSIANIDLTEFADIRYSKTGEHKATLILKDQYGRTVERNLIFNYD